MLASALAPLKVTFDAPDASGGIGLHFNPFPVVDHIEPGSQAARHPELAAGLVLVAVAGERVCGLDLQDATSLYRNAGWPLQLTLRHPTRSEQHFHQRDLLTNTDMPLSSRFLRWLASCLMSLFGCSCTSHGKGYPKPCDLRHALHERRWKRLPRLLVPSAMEPWVASKQPDTPLHVALHHRPPADAVRQLLAAWPGAIFRVTAHGNTALHVALQCGCAYEVTSLLLQTWPEAAKKKNADGMLPLHLVAIHKPDGSAQLVGQLATVFAAAIAASNSAGMAPLHCAVRPRSADPSPMTANDDLIVASLLELQPKRDPVPTCQGDLATPLHLACRDGASRRTISALVNHWGPKAPKLRMRDGRLPLHCGALGLQPNELEIVLAAWPAAIHEYDRGSRIWGARLPLHVAAAAARPLGILRLLLSAAPATIRQPIRAAEGKFALQLAVEADGPSDSVALLADAWPEACGSRLNKGIPLAHKAMLTGSTPELICALLRAWPAAIQRFKGRHLRDLLDETMSRRHDYGPVFKLIATLEASHVQLNRAPSRVGSVTGRVDALHTGHQLQHPTTSDEVEPVCPPAAANNATNGEAWDNIRRSEAQSMLKTSDTPAEYICPLSCDLTYLYIGALTNSPHKLHVLVRSVRCEMMVDPVTTSAGMTYERVKLTQWFQAHDVDPLTATKVSKRVIPNVALKSLIDSFKEQRRRLPERAVA